MQAHSVGHKSDNLEPGPAACYRRQHTTGCVCGAQLIVDTFTGVGWLAII